MATLANGSVPGVSATAVITLCSRLWPGTLFRAQIAFPVATPTCHPAAIAVHWRYPAHEPVNKTAPHTVRGAVAFGTCASMRDLVDSVRQGIDGRGGLAHDIGCRMVVGRHRPASFHGSRVSRTGSLRGISYCSTPTFIPPIVQHSYPVPVFRIAMAFNHVRVNEVVAAAPPAGMHGGAKCVRFIMCKIHLLLRRSFRRP